MLVPRQPTPDLTVPTLDHGPFSTDAIAAERGAIIVFYRGLHCPICVKYIAELDRLTSEFERRGFETVAISSDGEERARAFADKAKVERLRIGFDLPLGVARAWGLYISTSNGVTSAGVEEPPLFPEPGLFIVRPDRTLYAASVQTMPFVRPAFQDLVGALDFVISKDYPARGEYTGAI